MSQPTASSVEWLRLRDDMNARLRKAVKGALPTARQRRAAIVRAETVPFAKPVKRRKRRA